MTAGPSRRSASTTRRTTRRVIEVDAERAQYWLGVGAQPTEPVLAILKKTGDWQKFKGEPGPRAAARSRRRSRRAPSFEALGSDDDEAKGEAITQKEEG